MSWYVNPSEPWNDELPPELVVTNGDGSITQVYAPRNANDANDVLRDIDQLRRDLSGYHGQLKAHNDLQRHCDNQRKRISELEGLYAKAKADRDENAMNLSKEYDRAEFLARENAKWRALVKGLLYCAHEAHGRCARVPVGGERPFTCCPLYDFDAREYRCEKLMLELGMEVDE